MSNAKKVRRTVRGIEAIDAIYDTLEDAEYLGDDIELMRGGIIGSNAALVFNDTAPVKVFTFSGMGSDQIREFSHNLNEVADAMDVAESGDINQMAKFFFEMDGVPSGEMN